MVRSTAARQLTARDRTILEWIGRAGIASFDQLWRRYWAGRSQQTAMARLSQLARAEYLQMHICDVRRPGERVFTITEAGCRQLCAGRGHKLLVGLPPHSEIRQQLLAQDAYIALEAQVQEEGGVMLEWRSERQLRAKLLRTRHSAKLSRGALAPMSIPDAQVEILPTIGEHQILYVEIDGAYYGKMLWQKAKCLAETGQQIVWVCTPNRADYVRQAVASYPNIQVLCV